MQTSFLKSENRFSRLGVCDEIRKAGPPGHGAYQVPCNQPRHLGHSPERGLSLPPYIPRGQNILTKTEDLEYCRSGLTNIENFQACFLLLVPGNRAERQH